MTLPRRVLAHVYGQLVQPPALEAPLEQTLWSSTLTLVVAALVGSSLLWVGLFWWMGHLSAAVIEAAYAVTSVAVYAVLHRSRHYTAYVRLQLGLAVVTPALVTLASEGVAQSGGFMLWGFIAPLGALFFASAGESVIWQAAFLIMLATGAALEGAGLWEGIADPAGHPPLLALNVAGLTTLVFGMLYRIYMERSRIVHLLSEEQRRSEALLLNMLPKEVADQIKGEGQTVAERFESASVLFADIVGFTGLASELAPEAIVDLLDTLFSYIDGRVDALGLEKIKTIGDCYMVAAGIPHSRPDHAAALAGLALEIREYFKTLAPVAGHQLNFRIGIGSGPVVAGVIGRKRFVYDLWGDSVNTASRMESEGLPGTIQLTKETHELIKDSYECAYRGEIEVRGRGVMPTWFLIGRLPPTLTATAAAPTGL